MSQHADQQDMLDHLLNSLLDETLSDSDEARLADMLADSKTARTHYRKWLELHSALHWDYASAAAMHAPQPISEPTDRGSHDHVDAAFSEDQLSLVRRSLLLGGSLGAAGLLALAISWFAVLPRPEVVAEFQATLAQPLTAGTIVEITSMGGAASWSVGGLVVSDLAVGHRLEAGTVSLEGEPAYMTLRCDDGTEVTLAGESILEFDARSQKTLALRHGTLSVDARPQPPGRPMLIRTPTAEVEVMGTVFSLAADSDETQLGVEEGSVRLRRLADGQTVEVTTNHVATASLVTIEPMEAFHSLQIPADYRHTFNVYSRLRGHGELLAATDGLPSRIRAVPYIAYRNVDGTPIVHYGITVRHQDLGFVRLQDDSVVSVRYRMATPEPLRVMIGMRRPGGAFAGNFEASVRTTDVPLVDDGTGATVDGWRWIDIPVRNFSANMHEFPSLTPGHAVGLLLVDTFKSKAQLEVAEVVVRQQAAGDASQ